MTNMRVIASDLEFPEGPVAMPDGSVVLVEIRGERLTRVYPDGRKEKIADIPGGPNGAALGPDGHLYITNNGGLAWMHVNGWHTTGHAPEGYKGGCLQRVNLQTGIVETLLDQCGGNRLNGPNDLVFDKAGGLWMSDYGKRRPREVDIGAVYYVKPGFKEIVEVVAPMLPANGIGLSPDEKTLYVAETPTGRLWSFDIIGPGEIAPVPTIYRGEKGKPIAGLGGYQMFDSLAVEACGNICVATLISGSISIFEPSGKLIEQIATGDKATTNICFGGPDLKTAYITLSSKGQLLALDWPRAGLPLNFLNR